MSRPVKFLIAILIGLAFGLIYGLVISPIQYVNTTPDSLSVDYRSDYVLMTAEVFHADQDVDAAARSLGLLGGTSPVQTADQAIQFGLQAGYSSSDIQLLRDLAEALRSLSPMEGNAP